METQDLLTLEEAIREAMDKICEEGNSNSHYVHPTLHRQMAKAAEVVFDASMDGQEYMSTQVGE